MGGNLLCVLSVKWLLGGADGASACMSGGNKKFFGQIYLLSCSAVQTGVQL